MNLGTSNWKKMICLNGHDTSTEDKRGSDGECLECSRIRTRTRYHSNPDYRIACKNTHWKQQGIKNSDGTWFTIVDFDREYQIQQGRCKICKRHSTEFKVMLSVDHNHEIGIFRGLLCAGCNTKLDALEDQLWNSEALKYLKDSSNG